MSEYSLYKLDTTYWKRLRSLETRDVVVRSQCVLIEEYGCYALDFLGSPVLIDPQKEHFLSPHKLIIVPILTKSQISW